VGLEDQTIADQINLELGNFSTHAKESYQRVLKNLIHCQPKSTIDHPIAIAIGRCRVELSQQDIVSLVCGELSAGEAAYPIGFIHSVTANLRTGKIYRYSDLFRNDIDYVEKVRDAIWDSNRNDSPEYQRELRQFGSSKADFYLSSSCHYFGNNSDNFPFCLVIPTQDTSGTWRNKEIRVSFRRMKDILSDDPDLQFLI
jgi:hypothetical protein